MGFLGVGVPLPSRLGDLGERHELPQRRQRILGIFQGLRILLVETMHYGTNQKFGGLGNIGGGSVPPWPSLKPPLPFGDVICPTPALSTRVSVPWYTPLTKYWAPMKSD